MVIDTSALIAILQDEPERASFNQAIETSESRTMSVASFVEASLIIESRYGSDGVRDLDLSSRRPASSSFPSMSIRPTSPESPFGITGSADTAGLNFGDCFAYALAKSLDEPLLFKGADFARTDVTRWSTAP